MFSTARVGCFLNNFGGHGEAEEKELKLVFFISPIPQNLAAEISPKLADRLFRSNGDEWEPAKEISKASFASVSIPMQHVNFFSLPEGQGAGFDNSRVENCAISGLRASRTEGLDFRLEFDMVVPMDEITINLVKRYYKSTCFLTMETSQRELEVTVTMGSEDLHKDLQDLADAPVDGKSAAAGKDDDGDASHINSRASRRKAAKGK